MAITERGQSASIYRPLETVQTGPQKKATSMTAAPTLRLEDTEKISRAPGKQG